MDSRRRYVLWAAGAGAAGAVLVLRWRIQAGGSSSSREPTDFDSFLRTPRPQPVPPAAQGKTGGSSSTDFASFLRSQPPPQPVSTDFASFLRSGPAAAAAAAGSDASQAKQPEVMPEGAVPLLVLFGTEYGFAREIAEKAAEQLKAGGTFWPRLVNAADHPEGLPELAQQQAALLVFSTQGDGVPPTEARDFCDWLTAGGPGALTALNYSVCALGDSSYTHFCRCGKQLDAALAAAGARQLVARADIDREDWPAVDGWLQASAAALDALAAAGSLKTWADLGGAPAAAGSGQQQAAAAKKHSKSRPCYARVAAVEGLCVLSRPDDKDTLRLRLELGPGAGEAGLAYAPGDALGIWPTNPPALVDELLAQLGISGDEAVPPPSWHYQEQRDTDDSQADSSSSASSSSLRHLLGVAYDLKTPKLPQLLTIILEQLRQQQAAAAAVAGGRLSFDLQADATAAGAAATHGAAVAEEQQDAAGKAAPKQQQQQQQQQVAAELAACVAAAESLLADAGAAEAYLSARHVADVLQDFPSASLTTTQLLSVLRPLAPRLYSISSSPLEFSPPASGVEATIAVVRYTARGKQRQGVTSTQVAERLVVGDRLPVFISKNPDFRLPAQPSRPLIMVGPGTGLAPFRAFIQQRLLEAAAAAAPGAAGDQQQQQPAAPAAVGPMHLFFGCRRRDQDFLYGGQLQSWAEAGSIRLHTAFSREGPAKVYVQQRLREAGQQVWDLLQAGGHFYVCGDAGSMAGAVEAALLEVIGQGQGQAGEAGARAYLDQLAAEGRYQRDVWFS